MKANDRHQAVRSRLAFAMFAGVIPLMMTFALRRATPFWPIMASGYLLVAIIGIIAAVQARRSR